MLLVRSFQVVENAPLGRPTAFSNSWKLERLFRRSDSKPFAHSVISIFHFDSQHHILSVCYSQLKSLGHGINFKCHVECLCLCSCAHGQVDILFKGTSGLGNVECGGRYLRNAFFLGHDLGNLPNNFIALLYFSRVEVLACRRVTVNILTPLKFKIVHN